jgi:hypothetical protein
MVADLDSGSTAVEEEALAGSRSVGTGISDGFLRATASNVS